ncbi:MAG: hypothetical protein IJD20_05865, partial [Oscillospiraceae bacterium]|nr:hypothetical protein [Oscillospiraceae bacterium]
LTAMLGLAAVVLTTSGEMRALMLIGSVLLVGGIGIGVIFHESKPEKSADHNDPNTTGHGSEEKKPADE